MASKRNKGPERREDLIVQRVGEEVIVYDKVSHRAHSLNRSASLVFEKLDGKRDIDAITRELGKALGRTSRPELVATAVNELASADLLKPGAALPRRSVLRGLAAGLLPVVVSIAVPKAAEAASCIGDFAPCIVGDTCCDPCGACVPFGSGFICDPNVC